MPMSKMTLSGTIFSWIYVLILAAQEQSQHSGTDIDQMLKLIKNELLSSRRGCLDISGKF